MFMLRDFNSLITDIAVMLRDEELMYWQKLMFLDMLSLGTMFNMKLTNLESLRTQF